MHLRQHDLPPASKRFAIDIGGTFTDLVILDDQGDLRMAKAPSTPLDPSAGVIRAALKAHLTLSAPEFFIHGTTLGINTLLQRRSAFTSPTALLCLARTGLCSIRQEVRAMAIP
jgi:N-methylhydantoinase A/oxoprolinase/acetone carboxylase beta subunit